MSLIIGQTLSDLAVVCFSAQVQDLTVCQHIHFLFRFSSLNLYFINSRVQAHLEVILQLANLGQVRDPYGSETWEFKTNLCPWLSVMTTEETSGSSSRMADTNWRTDCPGLREKATSPDFNGRMSCFTEPNLILAGVATEQNLLVLRLRANFLVSALCNRAYLIEWSNREAR